MRPEPPTTGSIQKSRLASDRSRRNAVKRWWKACERFDGGSFAESLDFDPEGGARHEPGRG